MSEQKRLDRPDREKIADLVWKARDMSATGFAYPSSKDYRFADQILALFNTEQIDAMLVEARRTAKKQEKQRVMDILQKEYPAIETWQCWKELKEQ